MNQYLDKFVKQTYSSPGKVLDLGAGDFSDVNYLRQLGWEIEGVDLSTGVNLEQPFISKNAPFDLVYSNYVLQKINNRRQFIKTMTDNLKPGGNIFIHTFDISDPLAKQGVDKIEVITWLTEEGFTNIESEIFPFYDNEPGHMHWHKILQISAKKRVLE